MITQEQFTLAIKAAVDERGRDFTYPLEWRDPLEWASLLNEGDGYDLTMAEFAEKFPGSLPQCQYVTPDRSQAACLIGLALFKCGITLDWLSSHEGRPGAMVCLAAGVEGLDFGEDGLLAETSMGDAIDQCQNAQDNGRDWGFAYDTYISQPGGPAEPTSLSEVTEGGSTPGKEHP